MIILSVPVVPNISRQLHTRVPQLGLPPLPGTSLINPTNYSPHYLTHGLACFVVPDIYDLVRTPTFFILTIRALYLLKSILSKFNLLDSVPACLSTVEIKYKHIKLFAVHGLYVQGKQLVDSGLSIYKWGLFTSKWTFYH
jgi:hypothetical protein